MKFHSYTWLLTICLFALILFENCASYKGYHITVQPKGMQPGDTLYMGAYWGTSVLLYNKSTLNKQRIASFTGKKPLPSGMYSISAGGENDGFDFLISDNQPQQFTVTYDTANIASSIKFYGSDENTAFTQYIYSDSVLTIDYNSPKVQNYPMFQFYLRSTADIRHLVSNKDEYIQHYFDNIDFSDDRITRIPLLDNKLYNYFFHVLNPLDTAQLKHQVNNVLQKAANNVDTYNLCTEFLYNIFINSPLPDHDIIAQYIGNNYILNGYSNVFDSIFIERVKTDLNWIDKNSISSVAPDLKLQSISGDYIRLSDVQAPLTILFFIDPECGACKQITPRVYNLYKKYINSVNVYAVYVGSNETLWKEYVIKQRLDWINVWTGENVNLVYNNYVILGMPTIYLLDGDKRILAKDILISTLENLLNEKLQQK